MFDPSRCWPGGSFHDGVGRVVSTLNGRRAIQWTTKVRQSSGVPARLNSRGPRERTRLERAAVGSQRPMELDSIDTRLARMVRASSRTSPTDGKGALTGGGRGIRTPGARRLNGFQDRRIRPLCHPSGHESTSVPWSVRAAMTGMRRDEVAALRWDEIHLTCAVPTELQVAAHERDAEKSAAVCHEHSWRSSAAVSLTACASRTEPGGVR